MRMTCELPGRTTLDEGTESLILETVSAPDLILQGHGKELLALRHYERTPLGSKDIVVVYREDRQLIITAF
jgi:hypothetical protein